MLLSSYTSQNSYFDIFLTLLFGSVGLIMVHLDWPRPPLILGVVLGTLLEKYLFISFSRYGFEFLLRPTVIVLFLLAAAFVYVTNRRKHLRTDDAFLLKENS
jgi:TctA family transporter